MRPDLTPDELLVLRVLGVTPDGQTTVTPLGDLTRVIGANATHPPPNKRRRRRHSTIPRARPK